MTDKAKKFVDDLHEALEPTKWPRRNDAECYACGEIVDEPDTDNFKTWVEAGERIETVVCDECLRRGWHVWGRG